MGAELEGLLREAVHARELHLLYQPLVTLATGRPVGAEALARWDCPQLGPVGPDTFIPIAERSGLINDLGRWVLEEACSTAAAWDSSPDGPSLSVNVSPHQLSRSGLVDDVAHALALSGLPASRLCLEVTETAAVADLDETVALLERLRGLGVRIALDDFGTGFASLTMLRRLPLDLVKIDRSFVMHAHEHAQDLVVVRLAIDAAHSMGLKVCAEGVESAAQARQLVALGCDTAQGWFYGKPAPWTDELAASLASPSLATQEGLGQHMTVSGDLVTALTPDYRITYASSAARTVLGRSPAELVGTAIGEHVHPEDLAKASAVATSRDATADTAVVSRVRHADGQFRWLSTSLQALRDRDGTVREYVATSRDVSALVEARAQLDASEERFRGAFDGAPIGMALSDLDGRLLRINESLAEMIGRPAEDLVGAYVDDLTWAEDRAIDARNLDLLRSGGERGQRVRKRYVDAEGRPVPVDVWAAVIDDAEGNPSLVVAHVMPRDA